MGLYEVSLSMSLLGFAMGAMLANFHVCHIMLLLRNVLNKLVRNARPRGPVCFRCLMLICQYLVSCYFYLFYCLLDLSVVSMILYPCISCVARVALLVYMFVLCVACLGVVVILLPNVMDVFSVVEVLCWIDRVWSSKECACDSCVHLSVPSIGLVYVFVCRKFSPH